MHRRDVLRAFGGALLSLPMLEACSRQDKQEQAVRSGRAALGTDTARRFVAIMAPDGVAPRLFWPKDRTETGFALEGHLQPLARHRGSMILMKGIDNLVGENFPLKNGHVEGVAPMLTGLAPLPTAPDQNYFDGAGVSIDQTIAASLKSRGVITKTKSLHFGEEGTGPYCSISFEGAKMPSGTMTNADSAFRLLFDDPAASEADIAKARALKKSVLDGSSSDFASLSQKVSGEDKKRIEAHLAAIRDIELRLSINGCKPGTATFPDPADDGVRRTQMYEITALAMACDATRIATFSFRHSGGGGPQLPFLGVYTDIHDLSHQIPGEANVTDSAHVMFDTYMRWYEGEVAKFVDRLIQITLPDGSNLFDHTVILRGSEISVDHGSRDMPYYLLAGSKTRLRTGRYLELPRVPHNRLLTSVLHAFDVPSSGVGDPQYAGNIDAQLM